MAAHFRTRTSANLRQILDWTLFLNKHRKEINIEENKKYIVDLGLKRLNDIFLSIGEDLTGKDLGIFFIGRLSEYDKKRVLDNILQNHKELIPESKIESIVYKMKAAVGEFWKWKFFPDSYWKLWYGLRYNLKKRK